MDGTLGNFQLSLLLNNKLQVLKSLPSACISINILIQLEAKVDPLILCLFPQDQNVFDSKKKVKLTNAEGVEHKLAKKQLQAIDFNKALLSMYTNQVWS